MFFADTHCHLNLIRDPEEQSVLVERAVTNGINRIMVPGIDLQTSEAAILTAEKYEIVYAAIGIHPNESDSFSTTMIESLKSMAKHPKVKAIGEIGMDFFRNRSSRERQEIAFESQLELAEQLNLPVIIHSRNSIETVIEFLINWKEKITLSDKNFPGGVLHGFEGSLEQARMISDNGFFIGIGGPVTYKNALVKQDIARKLPIKSILLETDTPFISPHPFRGQQNQPSNIVFIAEKIAFLSEKPLKWIANETSMNSNKLFIWEH